MNLQSLVVVVLRLMAIDSSLRITLQLAVQLSMLLSISSAGTFVEGLSFLAESLLLIAVVVVAAVLLWVFAPSIARIVTRGVSTELSFGALSLADCYAVAFVGVGLLYIAGQVSQILGWSFLLFRASASEASNSGPAVSAQQIFHVIVTLIVGVVLFVNGRKWAVTLATRHENRGESRTRNTPSNANEDDHAD